MVKVFNKPTSITSNDFKNQLVNEGLLSKKSCYCGRLDPMARGEMLFLEDLECKSMDNYIGTDKTYEFEIIFGLSTDTDDVLGFINNSNFVSDTKELEIKFKNQLATRLKTNIQKFHRYSSYMLRKKDSRKPLWQWEKLGLLMETDIPTKNVNIYNINILEEKIYKLPNFVDEIITKIDKLDKRHDFRQVSIIKKWTSLKLKHPKVKLKSFKIYIDVSSGFYIRQLGNDIKTQLDFPFLIHDINRKTIIY